MGFTTGRQTYEFVIVCDSNFSNRTWHHANACEQWLVRNISRKGSKIMAFLTVTIALIVNRVIPVRKRIREVYSHWRHFCSNDFRIWYCGCSQSWGVDLWRSFLANRHIRTCSGWRWCARKSSAPRDLPLQRLLWVNGLFVVGMVTWFFYGLPYWNSSRHWISLRNCSVAIGVPREVSVVYWY